MTKLRKETLLTTLGRDLENHMGMVNPPIYQSSTILFPTLEAYHAAERGKAFYAGAESATTSDYSYGIGGTPTVFALQKVLCELEGGEAAVVTPSGLSAITMSLLAYVSAGDHVLMVDTVYGPTRRFCNKDLKRFNVDVEYYDPAIGGGIADLVRENTKVIFMEAPGSLTFEMQDIEAITKVARAKGVVTLFDNSWGSPLYCNPIEFGVDIVIHALTKYVGGHSDIMLGAVIGANAEVFAPVLNAYRTLGISASPADCSLALRGVRTMSVRMKQQVESVKRIMEWVKDQPEVVKVLSPMIESDSGYALWKKYCNDGGASLFSVQLDKSYDPKIIANMLNDMKLFGIGASWGGYESLVVDFNPAGIRSLLKYPKGTYLRFFVGVENADDLIDDLAGAFKRLRIG